MLADRIADHLLSAGYGTHTDPMIIEINSDNKIEFESWLREHSISGRWVNPHGMISSWAPTGFDEPLFMHILSLSNYLFYIPNETNYIFAKLRWCDAKD